MNREAALTRLTLRLVRMAEGANDELDAMLETVRLQLREGAPGQALSESAEQLAKVVMAVTGRSIDVERGLPSALDVSGVTRQIKSLPVSRDAQSRMLVLVQKLSGEGAAKVRGAALSELLAVINSACQELAQRQGRNEGGVRGLFGRRESDQSETVRALAVFGKLVRRALEHLDVVSGSPVHTRGLGSRLDDLAQVPQAEDLLREVVAEIDTIDARIEDERNQTSDFLDRLRTKLGGFEGLIAGVAADGESSLERSEALQSSLGADVEGLGSVASISDLAEIRRLVAETLQKISSQLEDHVKAERVQFERAQTKVAELSEQLTALECEAETLRDEVRQRTDLAIKDQLTGLYNRAGYEERSAELFARCARTGTPLSLVFVDCNKFKEINDTYGHAAGDLVLMKVADTLKARARASDFVSRFGGDEFVVLLPDTQLSGAEIYARGAYQEILTAGFNDNGKPLDVSISLGVTQLRAGDSMEEALARADEAMYKAKVSSGIRVSVTP